MNEHSENHDRIPPINTVVELFIGNLSFFCTEEHIQSLVDPISGDCTVRICRSQRRGNSSLGYGFIMVPTESVVPIVIEMLNGKMFMGRQLRFVDLEL